MRPRGAPAVLTALVGLLCACAAVGDGASTSATSAASAPAPTAPAPTAPAPTQSTPTQSTLTQSTPTASSAGSDPPSRQSTASTRTPAPTPASTSPGVSSPTATASPTPAAVDRTELVERLTTALAALPDGADVSLVVLDPFGRQVLGRNAGRELLPASTVKLLTGAAALSVLDPDRRFRTRVRHTGRLDGEVVTGSLVLEGGGDPVLDTSAFRTLVYGSRPHTRIEQLARRVAASVAVVRGPLSVAPDSFGGTPEAPGWKPDYVPLLEARRVHALTVDGGLDVAVLVPPPGPQLHIVAADDPPQTATARLRDALRAAGVELAGDPAPRSTPTPEPAASGNGDRATPSPPPAPPRAPRFDGYPVDRLPVVASVRSPELRHLVRFAFERSDNHIADTLYRAVGSHAGATDWVRSGEAVVAALADLGVATAGLRLADGSGLSRRNRVSARHIAQVDQRMRAGPLGPVWRDALAVAGEEGTLRGRLLGTVADGRFLGKTGTLDDVTALAGTVEGPDGRAAFHVAAIANLPPGVSRWPARAVFDDVVALLAEDAAGCERVPPSPAQASDDDGTSAAPRPGGLTVRCS